MPRKPGVQNYPTELTHCQPGSWVSIPCVPCLWLWSISKSSDSFRVRYTDNISVYCILIMPQRPTEKPPGRAAKCAQRAKVKAEGMVHRRGAVVGVWGKGRATEEWRKCLLPLGSLLRPNSGDTWASSCSGQWPELGGSV